MVIQLMCGLGNQMFQYAYGRCMEKQGHKVMYNLGWFKNYQSHYGTKRDYLLNYFNTKIQEIDRRADQVGTMGVWETSKYADQVPELKQELTLKNKYKVTIEMETGVHIRRDDLLHLPEVDNLQMDYYYDALDYLGAKEIYVFSDDIYWCRDNFKIRAEFVDYPDYVCFELFKNCHNKVIANSTFSWWGAYLGGGNVVAPAKSKFKPGNAYSHIVMDKLNWKQL